MFDEFIIAVLLTAFDCANTEQAMTMWEDVTRQYPRYGILMHIYFSRKLLRSICMMHPDVQEQVVKDNEKRGWAPHMWDQSLCDGLGNYT